MNFRYFLLVFIFSPILVFSISNDKSKPDWIYNYPISKDYYIGIGYCKKTGYDISYVQKAKNRALNQISSEISISISSNITNIISEKSGIVKEDFESSIKSFTKSNLKGYELFDKWENENEYWVYYRLSKLKFKELSKLEKEKVKSLSKDLFLKAKYFDSVNNIDNALNLYINSLECLIDYFSEPLEINYNGEKVYLLNEIYTSLQVIFSNIDLTPITKELNGKFGHSLKENLIIEATYNKDKGQFPIYNLPIKFFFTKGNGKLLEQVRTNNNGFAFSDVFNITSTDNFQLVRSELDINYYINQDSSSVILKKLIKSLSIPNCELKLDISNLSFYVALNENNFDNSHTITLLESKIKNVFTKKGFLFSNSKKESDVFIQISTNSRNGSELFGQYTSFVDLSISVYNLKSDKLIYKKSLSEIKGMGLNYQKANINAFNNASKDINQVVQEIIDLLLFYD